MTCCTVLPDDQGQLGELQLNHAPTTRSPCLAAWTRTFRIEPLAQEDIQ